jgi:hypothetical protein
VLGTATSNSSGSFGFTPTGLANGVHTLVATEYDQAGNAATASLTFTYDNVAPAMTESLKNDTGSSATDKYTSDPTLSGHADAGGAVVIKNGSTVLGSVTADSSGNWTYKPTLADGSYTLTASDTDLAGNYGSTTLSFTLDTTAPTISEMLKNDNGVSSTDKITTDPTLTGSSVANAIITLTENGATLGVTAANSSGIWTYQPASMAAGVQTIVATAADQAGNTAATSLTFTLSQPFAA